MAAASTKPRQMAFWNLKALPRTKDDADRINRIKRAADQQQREELAGTLTPHPGTFSYLWLGHLVKKHGGALS